MKIRKIILVLLFSILALNNYQHNSIYAEKEVSEESIHEHVPQIKKSSVSIDESSLHRDAKSYLQTKYGTQNWYKENHNTTEKVLNVKPIEMQSNIFESDRLDNAMIAAGKKTKYAGCGPVAIIGMVEFFARYFGYSEISINPDDIILQEKIAEEVLRNIKTRDVNTSNYGKQTLALPWDCTDGFNYVMKNHNLENTIQATDMGFFGVSKREKILKIKEQIDKGLPVTLYTAMAGEGPLGDHYVNVYSYEEWHGKDQNGRNITHIMLEIRLNWGKPSSSQYYMDADILSSFITGIIYYDVIYKYKYQSLPDMLFKEK